MESGLSHEASRCVNSGVTRLTFGSGTRLTPEAKESFDPDFFQLEGNGTSVCLATGFSRLNATRHHPDFRGTEPARISADSLYSQAALAGAAGCQNSSQIQPCPSELLPDPAVNLVSLTVLGLRVILLKTVVFNVLMTLRLWLSQ
ncbi:M1-specific T cell receptor alpha chain-like isoform 5-T5 [Menidia menidia]